MSAVARQPRMALPHPRPDMAAPPANPILTADSETPALQSEPSNLQSRILNPEPKTLNPEPRTPNPRPRLRLRNEPTDPLAQIHNPPSRQTLRIPFALPRTPPCETNPLRANLPSSSRRASSLSPNELHSGQFSPTAHRLASSPCRSCGTNFTLGNPPAAALRSRLHQTNCRCPHTPACENELQSGQSTGQRTTDATTGKPSRDSARANSAPLDCCPSSPMLSAHTPRSGSPVPGCWQVFYWQEFLPWLP